MALRLRIPRSQGTLCESIFENLPVGLIFCKILFDAHGQAVDCVYLKANKHFLRSVGLAQIAGKRVTEVFPKIRKTNPELFELCARVSSTGNPEQFELYGDTLEKWFLVSAYSPKTNYIVGLFHDITNQKQVEKYLNDAKIATRNILEDLQTEKEILAQSIAKDEAILSSIGDGLITTDTHGTIILVNRVVEKTLGLKLAGSRYQTSSR
ncbi:MAG: PAS domain-containing protein [Candidatus Shapirobacteria bacterium]|jgi:transcriptional regulator with PAS, ATPase and Fis domain